MTANSLIDSILEEIARGYHPGGLSWVKVNRPGEWRKMVLLEQRINETALEGNLKGLREGLNEYQDLILTMVRIFKTPKGETENLFGYELK